MLYSRKLTELSKPALLQKSKKSLPKEKKKREHFLTRCTTINSKWVKNLNVTPDIVKFLDENIGQTPSDINHSNLFSEPPPRVRSIKPKRNKWDLTKLKRFCTAKETPKQHKKTAHRIRAHICKWRNEQQIQLPNLSTPSAALYPQIKQPHQNMGRRSQQTILQRRHTDGQKTHDTMPKVTHYEWNAHWSIMRYHLMPARMTTTQKATNYKCCRGCGEKGTPLTLLVGMFTGVWSVDNCMEIPQKSQNWTTIWSGNPTPGHLSRENHDSKRHPYSSVHCSTSTTAKTWKQLSVPPQRRG